MALKLGIHTGPQDLPMEELLRIWRRADESGFHWASVWDHFYANPLESRDNPCFEGVASMAALAGATIVSRRSLSSRADVSVGTAWFTPCQRIHHLCDRL